MRRRILLLLLVLQRTTAYWTPIPFLRRPRTRSCTATTSGTSFCAASSSSTTLAAAITDSEVTTASPQETQQEEKDEKRTSTLTKDALNDASSSTDSSFLQQSFDTHNGPPNNGRIPLQKDIAAAAVTASSTVFPMDLVVGHDLVKQALMIAAINPACNSLVLSGPTGTCKSVLALSLQKLMMNSNDETAATVVHVPSTVSEDALTGSVDLEESLSTGAPVFQQGILTKAHRNILMMDDVNLMEDAPASVLFTAAMSDDHTVRVEREGISVQYPCRPRAIVATYNDAYGEGEDFSAHFLDRFAMQVPTDAYDLSVAERVQVVEQVEAFTDHYMTQQQSQQQQALLDTIRKRVQQDERMRQEQIVKAKSILERVQMTHKQVLFLCQQATAWDCPGQRGEIYAVQVAKTAAALDGRLQVQGQDLELAIELCIAPRGRILLSSSDEQQQPVVPESSSSQQLPPPGTQPLQPDQPYEQKQPQDDQQEEEEEMKSEEKRQQEEKEEEPPAEEEEEVEFIELPEEFIFGVDYSVAIDPRLLEFQRRVLQRKGRRRGGANKRRKKFNIQSGRFVKAIFPKGSFKNGRLAVGATLRAAAPHQILRRQRQQQRPRKPNDRRVVFITKDDFRIQLLKKKTGSLVIFVVDASGSMALNRMDAAKGAAMGLLQEAYKSRDKICLISFHGESANVVVPPTKSTALTKSRLESMPCGSKTPLADALVKAVRTGLNAVKVKQDTGRVILVVISDCRPNVPLCVSNGEVFDPSVDPDSKDGLPSRSFLKKEALAIAKQIGALGDFDVLCIDTEDKFVRTGIAEELARFALGNYFGLGSHADSAFISQAVRKVKT